MQLKKNIATSESGFIFNPSTGDSWSANPLAAEIMEWMKQGFAPAEIRQKISDKYEVDPLRLERDWDDFMNQLRHANLLETGTTA